MVDKIHIVKDLGVEMRVMEKHLREHYSGIRKPRYEAGEPFDTGVQPEKELQRGEYLDHSDLWKDGLVIPGRNIFPITISWCDSQNLRNNHHFVGKLDCNPFRESRETGKPSERSYPKQEIYTYGFLKECEFTGIPRIIAAIPGIKGNPEHYLTVLELLSEEEGLFLRDYIKNIDEQGEGERGKYDCEMAAFGRSLEALIELQKRTIGRVREPENWANPAYMPESFEYSRMLEQYTNKLWAIIQGFRQGKHKDHKFREATEGLEKSEVTSALQPLLERIFEGNDGTPYFCHFYFKPEHIFLERPISRSHVKIIDPHPKIVYGTSGRAIDAITLLQEPISRLNNTDRWEGLLYGFLKTIISDPKEAESFLHRKAPSLRVLCAIQAVGNIISAEDSEEYGTILDKARSNYPHLKTLVPAYLNEIGLAMREDLATTRSLSGILHHKQEIDDAKEDLVGSIIRNGQ